MDSTTLDSHSGDYAVFREQRWPTHERKVCLVTFGDEVTMRLMEGISNPEVTLRVCGEKIPPIDIATTDFVVLGVLDCVIKEEFARLAWPEQEEMDWGC